jgi:hypothetical protein
MAAIVRSGARRLAGSAVLQRAPAAGAVLQPKPVAGAMLQRTQALGVDALRRPFLARFMSSKHGDEIQERKEELYDLISLTENFPHTDYLNRLLLRELSAHVVPRPADPKWRFMRAAKRLNNVIRSVGIVVGLVIGGASVKVLLSLEEFSQRILKEHKEENKAAKEKQVAFA